MNLNPMLRCMVILRDNNHCTECGKEGPSLVDVTGTRSLDVHHIIPRSQGGKDVMENLRTLCTSCHRSIESSRLHTIKQKETKEIALHSGGGCMVTTGISMPTSVYNLIETKCGLENRSRFITHMLAEQILFKEDEPMILEKVFAEARSLGYDV